MRMYEPDFATQLKQQPAPAVASLTVVQNEIHQPVAIQRANSTNPLLKLQRMYGNRYVQRALAAGHGGEGGMQATREISEAIEKQRGLGQPLETGVRAQMESAFRMDFTPVRVHTGDEADRLNQALNARAFTTGRDIFFREGEYNPNSSNGRKLLAHELTHVVQQSGGLHGKFKINQPDDVYEQEADRVAEQVLHQAPVRTAAGSVRTMPKTGPMVQRQPAAPAPATLAGLTATRVAFKNAGAPDPANCGNTPAALGVDGPHPGTNGMEMIFQINGTIPAGTEFDITRTKATGTWQRDAAGAWSRLGGDPAGTSDDRHDADECLTPVGGRIFVVDTPGMGSLDARGQVFPDGTTVAATATAAVRKHSFAEWVIARNRRLGIGWTPISSPLFHRWHSIVSVARLGSVFPAIGASPFLSPLIGNAWMRVDTPSGQHNEIALGSIGTTGAIP